MWARAIDAGRAQHPARRAADAVDRPERTSVSPSILSHGGAGRRQRRPRRAAVRRLLYSYPATPLAVSDDPAAVRVTDATFCQGVEPPVTVGFVGAGEVELHGAARGRERRASTPRRVPARRRSGTAPSRRPRPRCSADASGGRVRPRRRRSAGAVLVPREARPPLSVDPEAETVTGPRLCQDDEPPATLGADGLVRSILTVAAIPRGRVPGAVDGAQLDERLALRPRPWRSHRARRRPGGSAVRRRAVLIARRARAAGSVEPAAVTSPSDALPGERAAASRTERSVRCGRCARCLPPVGAPGAHPEGFPAASIDRNCTSVSPSADDVGGGRPRRRSRSRRRRSTCGARSRRRPTAASVDPEAVTVVFAASSPRQRAAA